MTTNLTVNILWIKLQIILTNIRWQEDEQLLSNLREVQCLICSRLHQMFIADPNLAKLVHFQVVVLFTNVYLMDIVM